MASSKTIDQILHISIGVLLVALIAVVADAVRDRVIGVGDSAPDFTVRTDSGLTVSSSDFGGKVLVLNFWATWCPPCVDEMPSLDEFQKRFKDEGVVVLGVSVDEDEELYRGFLEKHGVSFHTARDPEARISAEYGTFRYPETYIIDSSGAVTQKIVGPTVWTDERMISYIRSLL
jgi:cytochrome c biogenesis protein CcmG/thiol:disulfide interchange protein DsbE